MVFHSKWWSKFGLHPATFAVNVLSVSVPRHPLHALNVWFTYGGKYPLIKFSEYSSFSLPLIVETQSMIYIDNNLLFYGCNKALVKDMDRTALRMQIRCFQLSLSQFFVPRRLEFYSTLCQGQAQPPELVIFAKEKHNFKREMRVPGITPVIIYLQWVLPILERGGPAKSPTLLTTSSQSLIVVMAPKPCSVGSTQMSQGQRFGEFTAALVSYY